MNVLIYSDGILEWEERLIEIEKNSFYRRRRRL